MDFAKWTISKLQFCVSPQPHSSISCLHIHIPYYFCFSTVGCSSIIALMMIIACAFYCSDKRKKSIKRKVKDRNTPQRVNLITILRIYDHSDNYDIYHLCRKFFPQYSNLPMFIYYAVYMLGLL